MNINGLSVYPAKMKATHCTISKGNQVQFKNPSPDENKFPMFAMEDDDGSGRILVVSILPGFTIQPQKIVQTSDLEIVG